MSSARNLVLLFVALAALPPSGNAAAQRGATTTKVKEAVKGGEQPQGEPAPAEPVFHADYVEITEPVLDGFVRGLQTEIALLKEFRDLLATYPTAEQYAACQGQVLTSPEAIKLFELFSLPDNASAEQVRRAMETYSTEMAVLVKKKCPLVPNEWNVGTKTARLKEIETQAAAATGAGSSSPGDGEWDAQASRSGPAAGSPWMATEPLSVLAYQILKERIIAFCVSALARPGTDFSVRSVKIPGSTSSYNVYTSVEATVLHRKCLGIKPLLDQAAAVYDPSGLRD
jgi:hypothetical protein